MQYKNHEIKIEKDKHLLKVEVTIKGKEYGLIFKKDQEKQTIDDMSPKESEVIKYKGGTIYVIKRERYHIKGLCPSEAGPLVVELEAKTKKDAISCAKKQFRAIIETTQKILKDKAEKNLI